MYILYYMPIIDMVENFLVYTVTLLHDYNVKLGELQCSKMDSCVNTFK